MPLGGYRPGSGRKKGEATLAAERIRNYIAEQVERHLNPIVSKAIEQAKAGNKDARDFLLDRSFGKPRQNVGLDGGEEGDPISIQISEIIAHKNGLNIITQESLPEASTSEENTTNGSSDTNTSTESNSSR